MKETQITALLQDEQGLCTRTTVSIAWIDGNPHLVGTLRSEPIPSIPSIDIRGWQPLDGPGVEIGNIIIPLAVLEAVQPKRNKR